MKVISQFQGCWLTQPIDILDNEKGQIQMRLKEPITPAQQQATINYLVAEGFVTPVQPPKDDFGLHFDPNEKDPNIPPEDFNDFGDGNIL